MKNSILIIGLTLLVSLSSMASNVEPKLWNNTGKEQTFKKGDTVTIKAGTKSAVYVLTGKVDAVCNAKYIKVNGYFVAIADVDAIVKYNTVK